MAELVEVVIADDRWSIVDLEKLANRAADLALQAARVEPGGYEIALLACDDAEIAKLNASHRGQPQPTNILSWPTFDLAAKIDGAQPSPLPGRQADWAESLGDLALSFDTCLRETENSGIDLGDHVTHLILHGCLHLLGFDHRRDGDAALMERLESKALASVGIADPYSLPDPIGLET